MKAPPLGETQILGAGTSFLGGGKSGLSAAEPTGESECVWADRHKIQGRSGVCCCHMGRRGNREWTGLGWASERNGRKT